MKYYRSEIVKQAQSWLGKNEKNGSHKEIIDIYNSHKPLARGYKMKYTSAWCSCFASAVAIKCGYTAIIPTEVGCEEHIKLFRKKGCWVESDAYTPTAGDYIFYDWEDNGKGDNVGYSNHVGIVEKVSGTTITVIEGNYSNSVKRRTIKVNAKYIRGYGVPKYDGYAPEEVAPTKSIKEVAQEVIDGKWGNGSDRKTKLINAGYNYSEVQAKVNELLKPKQVVHIVQKGEYLSKIAKKYGVKWADIAKKNNIKFPYIIKVGQKLIIK